MNMKQKLPPIPWNYSGIFYPEDPKELKALITTLLAHAETPIKGAQCILSPKGSLNNSGSLSALAWKAAMGRTVERILLLVPYINSPASTVYLPAGIAFETILGNVFIDLEIRNELALEIKNYKSDDIPFMLEPAVEMQLLFIKHIFPGKKVIPVLVGKLDKELCLGLHRSLSKVFSTCKEDLLIAVSTNLGLGETAQDASLSADKQLEIINKSMHMKETCETCISKNPQLLLGTCVFIAAMQSGLVDASTINILGRHVSPREELEDDTEQIAHHVALAVTP